MRLNDISSHTSDWFNGSGPLSEVVISSRIRLARNLAGFEFLSCCSAASKSEILQKLKDILMSLEFSDQVFYIGVDQASKLDKNFLVERHLISRHHAYGKGPRGAVVAAKESFTAMINEEDHLRIQVFKPGLQLVECWNEINKIDDMIERQVQYSFDSKYGYLTACPTNLGTGIRVSVMLHLPGLKMAGQISKLFSAAKDMNLAIRGLFGEGTEAVGDFYQISNQTTLGISEISIIDKFTQSIVPKIVEYENLARAELLVKQAGQLEDKIFRALGVLRNARLISSKEALFLLSHLRMGVNMKCIKSVSVPTINELFMLTQPAHLQFNKGKALAEADRDALRAEIIRSRLSQN